MTIDRNTKQFVFDRAKTIRIGFSDNIEVKLDQIINYDLDLDVVGESTIDITSALFDVDVINRFQRNSSSRVIYVEIEMIGYDIETNYYPIVTYRIPCDMKIIKFRMDTSYGVSSEMRIQLEGIVR
jgi:hypothetical protein